MDFFARKPQSTHDNKAHRPLPWAEKYRPKSLADVTAQDAIVTTLKKTLESSNLPHMLFFGPPGTGKTSTILALAKDLYGPELAKSRVLELNASDERGIGIVRNKIKNFARTVVSNPTNADTSNYPCPPFKIIVLDEADSMTQDAQAALRRIMENYSKYTRFCLVCNYVTRIIDPLASRCSKFRFQPLNETNALGRLEAICQAENLTVAPNALSRLLKTSNGDLRRAITLLQSAHGLATSEHPLDTGLVDEISGFVPETAVKTLLELVKDTSKPQSAVQGSVRDLVLEGWSVAQIIDQTHDYVLQDVTIPDPKRAKISLVLGEADRALVDGCDEHIVLLNTTYKMANVLKA